MADAQRKRKDRASRAYADGRLKDALELYREIVRADPNDLNARMKIGDIHRRQGNLPGAVDAYEWVAEAYAQDGLLLKAIAVCKVILSLDPRHTATQNMLADLYGKRRSPQSSLGQAPLTPPPPPDAAPPAPGAYGTGPEGAEAPVAPSHFGTERAPPLAVSRPAPLPSASPDRIEVPSGAFQVPLVHHAEPLSAPSAPASFASASAGPGEGTGDFEIELEPPIDAQSGVPAHTPLPEPAAGRAVPPPPPPPTQPPSAGARFKRGLIPEAQTWAGEIRLEDLERIRLDAQGRATEQAPDEATLDDEPVIELEEVVAPGGPPPPPLPDAEGEAEGVGPEGALPIPPLVDLDAREAGPVSSPEARPVPSSRPRGSRPQGLPEIPLFSDLPKAAFIELLLHLKHRDVRPGEIVIREGEYGDSFFVVAEGRVRVTRYNDAGQQIRLARLKDGAFFGEMALLQSGPRTATVVAETEGQLLEISRQAVEKVIAQYPTVATALRNFHRQRLLATCMATSELFRPFNGPDRRRLMEKFKAKNFERGEVLVQEETPATGLYILLHGRLVVTKLHGEEEVQLAELNSGEMFGEMSLLNNEPTSATVTAITDCFVIRLSRRKFQEVMMTHPHVLELVAKIGEERRADNENLLGLRQAHHVALLV